MKSFKCVVELKNAGTEEIIITAPSRQMALVLLRVNDDVLDVYEVQEYDYEAEKARFLASLKKQA